MMTTATGVSRARAAELLVLLYQYVQANTPSHPILLPAVFGLQEAVELYGRDEPQRAYERGEGVYELLKQARAASPDLPVP
jgi:hypothetical protein